jgi:hypothetical protein
MAKMLGLNLQLSNAVACMPQPLLQFHNTVTRDFFIWFGKIRGGEWGNVDEHLVENPLQHTTTGHNQHREVPPKRYWE